MKRRSDVPRLAGLLALAVVAGTMNVACDGGGGGSSGDADGAGAPLLSANVAAAIGGSFVAADAGLEVVVPAGALSADAHLSVSLVPEAGLPVVGAYRGDDFRGNAYEIRFTGADGAPIALEAPFKLVLSAREAPVHPVLAEVARLGVGRWERADASFYRPGSQQVVALGRSPGGTYRVAFRRLQADGSEAVARGRDLFLNETFGNEDFFGGVIRWHSSLVELAPVTALGLGLQVDLSRTPVELAAALTNGDAPAQQQAALDDPETTRALLRAGAWVGIKARLDAQGNIVAVGVTCALCHVRVSGLNVQRGRAVVALPLGTLRLDGVPVAALNLGALLAITPFATSQTDGGAMVAQLRAWGPGNVDLRALPDNPFDDGAANPTNIPPLWNFIDLAQQGYRLGWDGLYIGSGGADDRALASLAEGFYDLALHVNGAFATAQGSLTPQLKAPLLPPLLARLEAAEQAEPGNRIAIGQLLDLQAYLRSMVSPAPPPFDEFLAERGFELFNGRLGCARCHNGADFSGPGGYTVFTSPGGSLASGIKVPGLRGIAHTPPYLSDGSAASLHELLLAKLLVLRARDPALADLTAEERTALVEYLKSL